MGARPVSTLFEQLASSALLRKGVICTHKCSSQREVARPHRPTAGDLILEPLQPLRLVPLVGYRSRPSCTKSLKDPLSVRRIAGRTVRWFRWYEARTEVLDYPADGFTAELQLR